MNEEQKPRTQPPQEQHDQPGDQHAMHPQPESIRKDYRGNGKLDGRVALITGATAASGARSRCTSRAKARTWRSSTSTRTAMPRTPAG